MYRFMDCDDVSHAKIIGSHCEQTRRACPAGSVQLILCDTTEIDFGRSVVGLGRIGRAKANRGFYLHTGLLRDAATGEIRGLAGQELFYRRCRSRQKVHKNTKRSDPEREQVVWGKLMDQIGSPPPGVRWIQVCDRGADDYEVYLRAHLNRCGWVIRTARLNRKVRRLTGEATTLKDMLASAPVHQVLQFSVPRQGSRSARTAEVELRFFPFLMPPPSRMSRWIREHAPAEPLCMGCVQLVEPNPPKGAEALNWVLVTSEPVTNVEGALAALGNYSQRWGVDEYHKAIKTGCHVEERGYQTSERLERVTGLLAVLSVRLLQIRELAREQPDLPAVDVAPKKWVEKLAAFGKRPSVGMTIRPFVRSLGGLGGHLRRKGDGEPG